MKPIPDSIDDVDLNDEDEVRRFFQRIVDHGAAQVRRERLAAFTAGLIDSHGNILRRDAALGIDERLTTERSRIERRRQSPGPLGKAQRACGTARASVARIAAVLPCPCVNPQLSGRPLYV